MNEFSISEISLIEKRGEYFNYYALSVSGNKLHICNFFVSTFCVHVHPLSCEVFILSLHIRWNFQMILIILYLYVTAHSCILQTSYAMYIRSRLFIWSNYVEVSSCITDDNYSFVLILVIYLSHT